MKTNLSYTLTPTALTREVTAAGRTVNEARELQAFLKEVGKRAPVDTGLMPIGVRSYAQAGDHQQFVIELPPGINRIIWGEREGDRDAGIYLLAQPYRILIGDFVKGGFLGARMFYSPTPLNSLDQPLFHQNVPNINCRGYEGNGVGWVCLYHNTNTTAFTPAQKAEYLIRRCGGEEAYNNRNMSETDGTRFYQAKGAPEYLWDPHVWEKKSEEDGFEWTLNPDLWLPVKVKDQDHQDKHYGRGKPLTVRMAMDGFMHVYYGDDYQPKPVPALRRGETVDLFATMITEAYTAAPRAETPAPAAPVTPKATTATTKTTPAPKTNPAADVPAMKMTAKPTTKAMQEIMAQADLAAAKASKAAKPPPPKYALGNCASCDKDLPVGGSYLVGNDLVCAECYKKKYASCATCGETGLKDQMVWEEGEGLWLCPTHGAQVTCTRCATDMPMAKITIITSPSGDEATKLCPGCIDTLAQCNGCGGLFVRKEMFEHGLHILCETCLHTHKSATADAMVS